MKKRIGQMMALLMALIVTAGLVPIRAQAANDTGSKRCGDGVTWSLNPAGVLTISTDGTPGSHNTPTPTATSGNSVSRHFRGNGRRNL